MNTYFWLGDEVVTVARKCPMVAHIQRATASHFGIHISEMTSHRRARNVVRPRQVAMYLSRNLTSKSLPEIGRLFGKRDHTTVIHAIKTVERLVAVDPVLRASVKALRARLGA